MRLINGSGVDGGGGSVNRRDAAAHAVVWDGGPEARLSPEPLSPLSVGSAGLNPSRRALGEAPLLDVNRSADTLQCLAKNKITKPKEAAPSTFPDDGMSDADLQSGGIVVHILIIMYMFLGLAIICDEYFESALEGICEGLARVLPRAPVPLNCWAGRQMTGLSLAARVLSVSCEFSGPQGRCCGCNVHGCGGLGARK